MGGCLVTDRHLTNYTPGKEGRREWPFSLHPLLQASQGGPQWSGKHYIDVQIGPYMHTTIKARWEILLENFHLPHSFLLYN